MEDIKEELVQEKTCQCEEETCQCEECHDDAPKKEKKKKKKEIELLRDEVISLKEELAVSKNAYYKAYADTENLKKRLQNDTDTIRKYRIQSFAFEILPVIDNLERALQLEPKNDEMKNYMEGIKMTYQQLISCLEKEGVKVIDALDKAFDPNLHQALIQEKVEGVEAGIVVEEIQKGYILKDRVLRATLVKVSE